jgi:UDP-N-acetylmuramate dehydrogenase
MMLEENVPLAELTTFRLGGPARFLLRVRNIVELQEALAFAKEKNLPTLLLGGGSNVLASDAGYAGVVIKIELQGIERDQTMLIAAAGESWDALVAHAVNNGLWGVENLSGIPGTVGAAPIQNIGAYGSEAKDTLVWVEALDTQTNTIVRMGNSECDFAYRTSRFKREPGRFVIVRAAFALQRNGVPNTSYKDLAEAGALSLPAIRERVLAIRTGKFPDLAVEGTAGSFFLNPIVSKAKAEELAVHYPGLPQFSAEGGSKLSLAWLLDNVLELKGFSVGGARLYEKQPLVIAASRDTTANDVQTLAEKVRELVKNKFGITIEPEVQILK